MIIANGTIEIKQKTPGGLDEKGYPIEATATWGDPIPCQYYPNSSNLLAIALGNPVTAAQYTILLEEMAYQGERLRLTDSVTGEQVGEFSVKSIEQLEAVAEIKLIVEKAI